MHATRLIYAVAMGVTLVIASFAVLGATNGLDSCLKAGHSADVCHYTLR